MNKLLINWEDSIRKICLENKIPFPINNISWELMEIFKKNILVFNGFWDLNTSRLRVIFTDANLNKKLNKDNMLKILIANNIINLENISFLKEEIIVNRNIKINNCSWNNLILNKSGFETQRIDISWNKKIKKITFSEFKWESNIYIDDACKLDVLNFDDFYTTWVLDINTKIIKDIWFNKCHIDSKQCVITNLKVTNILTIQNSNLWEFIFNWISIKKLKLENSTLNNCLFNWINFPEKIEDIWDNKKMKDNYRQLKHVMDKNANYTEANKFYVQEMEYHGKVLEIFSLEWLIHSFKNTISNFWNNWVRTLLVIFIFVNIAWYIDLFYSAVNQRNIINKAWAYDLIDYYNPTFLLPNQGYLNWESFMISYNWLEKLSFLMFKVLYWVMIWHLWVAIRRTTRR